MFELTSTPTRMRSVRAASAGQQRPALEVRAVGPARLVEVVAVPDAVEAEPLEVLPALDERRERQVLVGAEPEAHVAMHAERLDAGSSARARRGQGRDRRRRGRRHQPALPPRPRRLGGRRPARGGRAHERLDLARSRALHAVQPELQPDGPAPVQRRALQDARRRLPRVRQRPPGDDAGSRRRVPASRRDRRAARRPGRDRRARARPRAAPADRGRRRPGGGVPAHRRTRRSEQPDAGVRRRRR